MNTILDTNCTCSVPDVAHGNGCGWNNAKLIVFEGDTARNIKKLPITDYESKYPKLAQVKTTPKEQIDRHAALVNFLNQENLDHDQSK